MTNEELLQADFLDILFEKRNKFYGAYLLRRRYPQQLAKALFTAVGSVFLLLFFFQPSDGNKVTESVSDSVFVTEVETLHPEQKNPEPSKVPHAAKTEKKQQTFIDKITIVQKDVPTEMPAMDALPETAVSNTTTGGEIVGLMQSAMVPGATEKVVTTTTAIKEPAKEVVPDKQPQFPGGMQAWAAFLNRYLQSPQELELGEKRTVLIRFHVAEDGSVANFQILQSAGGVFDNEVIRVLKKMPKWTPATKAGQPIPVSFTQPVTFVGITE